MMQRRPLRSSSLVVMVVALFVMMLFVVHPVVTQAASCTVGSGSYPTIQSAVNDGNCTTISVPAGTYTENVTINRDVTINGATTGSTIVDGNNAGSIFHITAGRVTLDHLTMQHGTGVTLPGFAGPIGGAALMDEGSALIITNSTISDNHSSAGGGIYTDRNTSLTITNSTFSGNSAEYYGGGVGFNLTTTARIINTTFSGNSAGIDGGGIYNIADSLTLINSIVANSSGGDCTAFGLASGSKNNLIEDGGCGTTNGVNGNIVGQDPNLGALANNGGPTRTHELLSGSPAIGAGSAADCPATDQRGVTRQSNTNCDIGAYESSSVKPTITSTNTSTSTPSNTPTNTSTPTSTATETTTATPSNTATSTPTASNTPTTTPTASNTATSTLTPTRTPTALPVQSTVIASADSYVQQKDAKKNFGSKSSMIVDGTDDPRETYLRFTVNAAGTIRKAVLRLYVTDGTKDGPRLYQAANTIWSESTIIWNNRPGATGPLLGNVAKVNDKVWVEYDVTSLVTANGTYSFVLVADSTESIEFTSREGSNKPQLVLTVQP